MVLSWRSIYRVILVRRCPRQSDARSALYQALDWTRLTEQADVTLLANVTRHHSKTTKLGNDTPPL